MSGLKDTIATTVKQSLLALGQYRRTLARTTLPGVAVLGYHGLRPDDLPAGAMATCRNALARPTRLIPNNGAPHPSTPVAPTGSPARDDTAFRMATCNGCAGSR